MWKGLLIAVVFVFLTVSSLSMESVVETRDSETQTPKSESEPADEEDEEEEDDALDETSETSDLGLIESSFENYDGDIFEISPKNTSNYIEEDTKEESDGEVDQEVTLENASRPQHIYPPSEYHRESSRSAELPEGIREPNYDAAQSYDAEEARQPVYEPPITAETTYTVSYDSQRKELPPVDDNRLLYQPELDGSYRQEASQSRIPMYNAYARPQETTTNSYERRMSQVDQYWREEERRKRIYESQNTYRHPSANERIDGWDQGDCTYNSMGRLVNCLTGVSNNYNTHDAISMKVPSSPPLPLSPTPNESADSKEVEAEKAESKAERSAFLRANHVYLSAPRWPVRDMDRLGSYPRHPACRLQPEWGVGPEERSAWFYSQPDGRCLWFSYNGHGGNANRFYSRANCESLCVFDQFDLCQNARCGYPGSHCMLRGDERCKAHAKSRGREFDTECPPDQPVCRARRAIIPPEYNTELIPYECTEHVDTGGCLLKNPQIRYHYDVGSNTCRAFYFHGCGGNNNRFESMQECMNHCAL
ncbi:expressed protein [Echinococcus multilocularis]|uniref:Expressed protein n=1 Tax=Echinococcus multilocularis TaxID=6211 RepID=A0A068XXG2_ECHMU|nr:expressed protein [Echinococcus multilocularis]